MIFPFLFSSETKYDSGCGWPAFYDGEKDKIKELSDNTHGMVRTEVRCKIVSWVFYDDLREGLQL